MNHFLGMRLKGTGPFKNQAFDFTPGLHVVYGWNKSNVRNNTNANGAGKSFFFHQPQEILKDTPIIGEKSDRVKKGERTLYMGLNDKRVEITRKNTKLSVTVDGKPKKFRTQAICKEWISKHFPLTQEDISTYVHIDARMPHPLVMGKTADRRRFFTSFFTLDKLDLQRKLYMAELSKLAKVKAAYSELRSEYKLTREDAVSKEDLAKLQERDVELTGELRQLTKRNDTLQEISTVLAFYEAAQSQIKQVLKMLDSDTITQEAFDTKLKEVKWHLEKDQQELQEALDYEDYQRENKVYLKKYNALSKRARNLSNEYGLGKALKKVTRYVDRVDEIDAALQLFRDVLKKTKPEKPEKVEAIDADRGEVLNKLDALQHQLDHVEKFKKGICDACGQSVKVKDPDELRKKVKKLKAILQSITAYTEYKNELVDYKRDKEVVDKAHAEITKLEEEVEPLRKFESVYKELRDMPDKPEKFEGKKLEVAVKQRMVDEDKEQLQLLKFIQPNIEIVTAYYALTEKDKKRAADAGKLQVRIEEINEKLSSVRTKLEVQKTIRQRSRRLKDRLIEMKMQLADEPAWRLLADAYSEKGVKKLAIQAVSHRLMEIVNRYAKMVFPEDYTFSVEWTKADLNLLVHRKYGKRTETSDVRKLSGAESKIFTFILILALLTFVPKRKRSSLMILDEPAATFSLETLDSFRKLLVILNKVIPTIVVITPRVDERYEGAKEYTVMKEQGYSRIVSGHPSRILAEKSVSTKGKKSVRA